MRDYSIYVLLNPATRQTVHLGVASSTEEYLFNLYTSTTNNLPDGLIDSILAKGKTPSILTLETHSQRHAALAAMKTWVDFLRARNIISDDIELCSPDSLVVAGKNSMPTVDSSHPTQCIAIDSDISRALHRVGLSITKGKLRKVRRKNNYNHDTDKDISVMLNADLAVPVIADILNMPLLELDERIRVIKGM